MYVYLYSSGVRTHTFVNMIQKNKKENLIDPHNPEKSVSWSGLAIKDSALIQGKDELGAGLVTSFTNFAHLLPLPPPLDLDQICRVSSPAMSPGLRND